MQQFTFSNLSRHVEAGDESETDASDEMDIDKNSDADDEAVAV